VIAELLGAAFGGTLVSDFYAVYDQFDCPQQKCLTHLLRELRRRCRSGRSWRTMGFPACKSLTPNDAAVEEATRRCRGEYAGRSKRWRRNCSTESPNLEYADAIG